MWFLVVNRLSKEFTDYILDGSVNANSFCVQCSVMASAVLTRDRVLHHLPRQVKFYFLSFHVIDIKRLFQRNKLLYVLSWKVSFYRILGLVTNINISNKIKCGMTTCPGHGESCHRWPSLIKLLTTQVLQLKEIRYCLIVARASIKTLAYYSLPE